MQASSYLKILSAAQMRIVDSKTILHEGISPSELMERAAEACVEWLLACKPQSQVIYIVCGLGNNGGDGLAVTRFLRERGFAATAYVVEYEGTMSEDAREQMNRLHSRYADSLKYIETIRDFPTLNSECLIIDALLGSGTTRETSGLLAATIQYINQSGAYILAIDLPSGLMADASTPNDWQVIKARQTLSFECPKWALLWPENEQYVGQWQLLSIGLNVPAILESGSHAELIDHNWLKSHIKMRSQFAHKGMSGRVLLVAGSRGHIGAAILAARGCLRSGVGLLTVHLPECGYMPVQTAVPEAMVEADMHPHIWSEHLNIAPYDVIALGPGLGQDILTERALDHLFTQVTPPLVLDADAINMIAKLPERLQALPAHSILTPHLKEFERLVGCVAANSFERHAQQLEFSKRYQVYIVLKGAYTCISTPDGRAYFNTTGNPGMAKGGSGDVLTGVIAALLAQGYSPLIACLWGVYAHGHAGDRAAQEKGQMAMLPSDLIDQLFVP